ncbi:MAG: hypothetical protein NZ820_13500 [Dehalococcoidia bacterium]|nr:hypothetical protein [Dehalococcoidia bacterium]
MSTHFTLQLPGRSPFQHPNQRCHTTSGPNDQAVATRQEAGGALRSKGQQVTNQRSQRAISSKARRLATAINLLTPTPTGAIQKPR